MATRMEKMTCSSAKRAQQRRHFEERIRQEIRAVDIHDMQKTGRRVGHNIESVWVGSDVMSVTGDEWVATLASKLLAQSGLLNVEVYPHCAKHGVFVASGAVRE